MVEASRIELATLVRGAWPAGRNAVPWDGGGLGLCVYLYRLRADARVESRTLFLLPYP